ncbi:MAG: DUF4193 family protein [Actinomycetia bacterium]|nr:DUF4193 family protein [Actinomycetes bacterium]
MATEIIEDSEGEQDTSADIDEGVEDPSEDTDTDDESKDTATEETPVAALDELEAEELEMLTDDETDETLVIDEAAEMRAIRRAEIAMQNNSIDEATSGEFVCSSCFLVKRESQLANKRKKICLDCAS